MCKRYIFITLFIEYGIEYGVIKSLLLFLKFITDLIMKDSENFVHIKY